MIACVLPLEVFGENEVVNENGFNNKSQHLMDEF